MVSFSNTYSIEVSCEPVKNMMYSLVLMQKSVLLSGINHWPTDAFSSLTEDEKAIHRLVVEGFPLFSQKKWTSYSSYLNWIEEADPYVFVKEHIDDLILYCLSPSEYLKDYILDDGRVDIDYILESRESYIKFLKAVCRGEEGKGSIDLEFEKEVYSYLINPEEMQKVALNHLRMIWDRFLAEEWVKVEKIVIDSVNALNQLDFSLMDIFEAFRHITDKNAEHIFKRHTLERMKRINKFVFVPSPHVGPYMSKLIKKDVMWIFFGARLPKGVNFTAPSIDHQEIVTKLSAMADATRLRILKHISTVGERSSTQIINDLNLSQSAASRHLKQLSATGILEERRVKTGKCYKLNGSKIEAIFKTVEKYLIVDN